jgi:S-DNA-T family DNA segregation ATPase FtsK/SpoIIIE
MALSFISRNAGFSWGGAVGELLNGWFVKWIGTVGTGALLTLSVFAYVIWRFNPTFTWPEQAFKNMFAKATQPSAEMLEPVMEEEPSMQEMMEAHESHAQEAAKLFIDKDVEEPTSTNKLKAEGKGITVIMPESEEHDPLTDFNINEKESEIITVVDAPIAPPIELNEALVNDVPLSINDKISLTSIPDLDLEIKPIIDDEIKEITGEDAIEELEDNAALAETEDTTALEVRSDELATVNYDPTLDLRDYKYPTLELLETHGSEKIIHDPTELETHKNQIIATLKNYDIAIQRIAATVGPTVTLYEIVPAPGVRISRIKNLEDDIALSLAALGIRIIAPIPGKGTVGIEVPNVRKTVVSMKTLLSSDKFQNNNYSLPIAIGKKIDNENFIVDLAAMPHLLMAGATGQGKSVGLNAVLVSLLYKKHPSQLKFVLVDPKKVELSLYRIIEKHFLAKLPGEEESIITDTKKVVHTLNALCIEMDNRYDLLKEAGCRNIREYNEKFTQRKLNPQKGHQYLPFIVLVVDEFADLIMTAGKEVEMPIARLAQLARAIGIHLIIATQRPSVNIITGTIKANFPARIGFKVSSKIDSRTILDTGGAEQLIGKGDMLISYNGEVTRLQCAFVDTPEVERICEFIANQRGYPDAFLLPEYVDEKEEGGKDFDDGDRDVLFSDAAKLIVQNQVGSTSLIQRRMKLGYNRAGRLMDQLERAGIVGPNLGSKAREVRFKSEMELQEYLDTIGS